MQRRAATLMQLCCVVVVVLVAPVLAVGAGTNTSSPTNSESLTTTSSVSPSAEISASVGTHSQSKSVSVSTSVEGASLSSSFSLSRSASQASSMSASPSTSSSLTPTTSLSRSTSMSSSPSSDVTPSASHTTSVSASPSPSTDLSPSATLSPSHSASSSPSDDWSLTPSMTQSPSTTLSVSDERPSWSASATQIGSVSFSRSNEQSRSAASVSLSLTRSSSVSLSVSLTVSPTVMPSTSLSVSDSSQPTASFSLYPTPTASNTASSSPTASVSPTLSGASPSASVTPVITTSPTPSATLSPSSSRSRTFSLSSTTSTSVSRSTTASKPSKSMSPSQVRSSTQTLSRGSPTASLSPSYSSSVSPSQSRSMSELRSSSRTLTPSNDVSASAMTTSQSPSRELSASPWTLTPSPTYKTPVTRPATRTYSISHTSELSFSTTITSTYNRLSGTHSRTHTVGTLSGTRSVLLPSISLPSNSHTISTTSSRPSLTNIDSPSWSGTWDPSKTCTPSMSRTAGTASSEKSASRYTNSLSGTSSPSVSLQSPSWERTLSVDTHTTTSDISQTTSMSDSLSPSRRSASSDVSSSTSRSAGGAHAILCCTDTLSASSSDSGPSHTQQVSASIAVTSASHTLSATAERPSRTVSLTPSTTLVRLSLTIQRGTRSTTPSGDVTTTSTETRRRFAGPSASTSASGAEATPTNVPSITQQTKTTSASRSASRDGRSTTVSHSAATLSLSSSGVGPSTTFSASVGNPSTSSSLGYFSHSHSLRLTGTLNTCSVSSTGRSQSGDGHSVTATHSQSSKDTRSQSPSASLQRSLGYRGGTDSPSNTKSASPSLTTAHSASPTTTGPTVSVDQGSITHRWNSPSGSRTGHSAEHSGSSSLSPEGRSTTPTGTQEGTVSYTASLRTSPRSITTSSSTELSSTVPTHTWSESLSSDAASASASGNVTTGTSTVSLSPILASRSSTTSGSVTAEETLTVQSKSYSFSNATMHLSPSGLYASKGRPRAAAATFSLSASRSVLSLSADLSATAPTQSASPPSVSPLNSLTVSLMATRSREQTPTDRHTADTQTRTISMLTVSVNRASSTRGLNGHSSKTASASATTEISSSATTVSHNHKEDQTRSTSFSNFPRTFSPSRSITPAAFVATSYRVFLVIEGSLWGQVIAQNRSQIEAALLSILAAVWGVSERQVSIESITVGSLRLQFVITEEDPAAATQQSNSTAPFPTMDSLQRMLQESVVVRPLLSLYTAETGSMSTGVVSATVTLPTAVAEEPPACGPGCVAGVTVACAVFVVATGYLLWRFVIARQHRFSRLVAWLLGRQLQRSCRRPSPTNPTAHTTAGENTCISALDGHTHDEDCTNTDRDDSASTTGAAVRSPHEPFEAAAPTAETTDPPQRVPHHLTHRPDEEDIIGERQAAIDTRLPADQHQVQIAHGEQGCRRVAEDVEQERNDDPDDPCVSLDASHADEHKEDGVLSASASGTKDSPLSPVSSEFTDHDHVDLEENALPVSGVDDMRRSPMDGGDMLGSSSSDATTPQAAHSSRRSSDVSSTALDPFVLTSPDSSDAEEVERELVPPLRVRAQPTHRRSRHVVHRGRTSPPRRHWQSSRDVFGATFASDGGSSSSSRARHPPIAPRERMVLSNRLVAPPTILPMLSSQDRGQLRHAYVDVTPEGLEEAAASVTQQRGRSWRHAIGSVATVLRPSWRLLQAADGGEPEVPLSPRQPSRWSAQPTVVQRPPTASFPGLLNPTATDWDWDEMP